MEGMRESGLFLGSDTNLGVVKTDQPGCSTWHCCQRRKMGLPGIPSLSLALSFPFFSYISHPFPTFCDLMERDKHVTSRLARNSVVARQVSVTVRGVLKAIVRVQRPFASGYSRFHPVCMRDVGFLVAVVARLAVTGLVALAPPRRGGSRSHKVVPSRASRAIWLGFSRLLVSSIMSLCRVSLSPVPWRPCAAIPYAPWRQGSCLPLW
ncbi:hypothetical protein GYH30_051721 [Glycine max]|nr:hypothetical protein GYH30_051721 [Glycine max]